MVQAKVAPSKTSNLRRPDGTLEAALAEIEEEQLQKVQTRNPHSLQTRPPSIKKSRTRHPQIDEDTYFSPPVCFLVASYARTTVLYAHWAVCL